MLGLVIVVVAVCKANPHEPWVDAFKRTLPTFVAGEARYGGTKATQVRRRKGIKLGKGDVSVSRRSSSGGGGGGGRGGADNDGVGGVRDADADAEGYDIEQPGDYDGYLDTLDMEPGFKMAPVRRSTGGGGTGGSGGSGGSARNRTRNAAAIEEDEREEREIEEATALSLALSRKDEELATLKAMAEG